MRIDFKKARFVTSAPSLSSRPKDSIPEILIVGRSNVGKSSLINALTGQKLAFKSKKAGKTKLLNFVGKIQLLVQTTHKLQPHN